MAFYEIIADITTRNYTIHKKYIKQICNSLYNDVGETERSLQDRNEECLANFKNTHPYDFSVLVAQLVQAYHQYGVSSHPALYITN